MMKWILYISIFAICLASCKTEFERVRTSNDPELIYAAADTLASRGDYSRAILLYEIIIPAYRGKIQAEDLNYKFADTHYKNGNYVLSSHYFKTFADTYTTSPNREEAMYLSALSEYYQAPRYKLDQQSSTAAIDAFQLFANTFPESERVDEVNTYVDELRKKQEQKAFEAGKLYYNLKNYNSAVQSLENMLKDYPGSGYTEEAQYLIAKAYYEWATRSIYSRQIERFTEGITNCDLFVKKYPESHFIPEVNDFKSKCQEAINKLQNG
jgi:outer membrane protein assembly factor BamD